MTHSLHAPLYHIGIVGCGVGGLTAALLLAQAGHHVSLYEQAPHVGPVGAGVLLQPSGQLALERLEILQAVTARSARIDRLYARTHHGRTLIDLPYAGAGVGLHAYGLHRGDLFAVLHERVQAVGASVSLNRRIVRCDERAEAVELFDDQQKSQGSFDFVIVGDGARSTLRSASSLRALVYRYPHCALWALGISTVVGDHLLQATHGSRQLCGMLPMGLGRCSLFWSVDRDEKEALLGRGIEQWRRQVIQLVPEAEELLAGISSFEQTRFTDYSHVHMNRWYTRRCLFIGDAAHAMSPHLGQGINLALLDGLAFAHALSSTGSPIQAFREYTAIRRSHTRFYETVTFLLSPFFQSRGFVKGMLRDAFLPHLHHVPIVGQQMLLTMTGLKRSFLGGRLHLPS